MERPENLSSNNNSLDSFNSSKYREDEKAYENSQDLNEAPLLIISGEKETILNEVKLFSTCNFKTFINEMQKERKRKNA